MSDKTAQAFLETILANPDDDAPRLVFADWLEEHGDSARAEFIRVQIERARLPHWDARQVRLRLRERALIQQHGQKWKEPLPSIEGVYWEGFRRGFVATANFNNFTVFREKARACWAAAPIEAIAFNFSVGRQSVDSIAPVAGLRELTLHDRFFDPREIDRFADAPLLSTLRSLNIRGCRLGAEGFRRLLASPHLGNLRALRVPGNSIGNGGISALLNALSLKSLEELDIGEEDSYGRYGEDPIIEAAGVEELTTWPGMTRLRSLTLSGNAVGRYGLRTLLLSPRAVGLKELVLRDNGLNGSGMRQFGSAHPDVQLDVLNLGGNVLGDEGAEELESAPCLRELKVLELDRCEIEPPGAHRLAKAPFFDSLRRLNVSHNSFGPEGLHSLLERNPPQLHTLQMDNNDLSNEGVSHLAKSPASNTLLELDLRMNGLDFQGLQALAQSKHLRNLLILRLNGNPIDKLAAATFPDSSLAKRLAVLEMGQMPGDEDIPF